MTDIVDGGNAFSFGDPSDSSGSGSSGSFPTVVRWSFEDYWQGQGQTSTFFSSGAPIDFVVPPSVTFIQATLRGGAGGGESIDNVPQGGFLVCRFTVTPGETLRIRVGGDGSRAIPGLTGAAGAYNGGGNGGNGVTGHTGGYGGGGATDLRRGGDALSNRIAVAAGGGGNAGEGTSHRGGGGGADVGQIGYGIAGPAPGLSALYYGGQGGTQSSGGMHGVHGTSLGDGSLGQGGAGKSATARNGGGGGGGGYYGGGGGGLGGTTGTGDGAGGGGGSNYAAPGITVLTNAQGVRTSVQTPNPMLSLEYTEQADLYIWEINPNDGGSPFVEKSLSISQSVGPNRLNLVQEGQSKVPTLSFSGVILTQQQYETLELWFDRRVLIKLTDDLGRIFYGVFSKFNPKRSRRVHNYWYHTYDAEFTATAYMNASGQSVYGRMA